jgi:hypothetical protein
MTPESSRPTANPPAETEQSNVSIFIEAWTSTTTNGIRNSAHIVAIEIFLAHMLRHLGADVSVLHAEIEHALAGGNKDSVLHPEIRAAATGILARLADQRGKMT